ncbi:hypothetical protein R3P38DRAFT_2814299 [Favolaschia claudopus]|uniref:Uncharacterized protein n=1 Tax=Favolaschia claudopus TaxID=2862362 RepID=A0AAV9Z3F1_9AGAR
MAKSCPLTNYQAEMAKMPKTRVKRSRAKVAKENKKNLRLWAEGARELVLKPHIEGYQKAMDKGWRYERKYWKKVCREFHARIHWRTQDHEEPVVRVWDENQAIEDEEVSPEDEVERSTRVDELNRRIRRWFVYRVRKLRKHQRTTGLDPLKDPFAILLAKLSGLTAPPKARQAYQQFMREDFTEKIAPVVAEEWAKQLASAADSGTRVRRKGGRRGKTAEAAPSRRSSRHGRGAGEEMQVDPPPDNQEKDGGGGAGAEGRGSAGSGEEGASGGGVDGEGDGVGSSGAPPPSQAAQQAIGRERVMPPPSRMPAPTAFVACPPNAAKWFSDAYALMTADDLGCHYNALIAAWTRMEAASRFEKGPTNLPHRLRPQQVSTWITRGRRDAPPVVEKPAERIIQKAIPPFLALRCSITILVFGKGGCTTIHIL